MAITFSSFAGRIDDSTAYEPDAIVYGGPKLPPAALEVTDPMIVVEVLSPSSQHIDLSLKLAGYFRLPRDALPNHRS